MNISDAQVDNLVNLLDGYAEKGGHHLNVNVFTRETLLDAHTDSALLTFSATYLLSFGLTLRNNLG